MNSLSPMYSLNATFLWYERNIHAAVCEVDVVTINGGKFMQFVVLQQLAPELHFSFPPNPPRMSQIFFLFSQKQINTSLTCHLWLSYRFRFFTGWLWFLQEIFQNFSPHSLPLLKQFSNKLFTSPPYRFAKKTQIFFKLFPIQIECQSFICELLLFLFSHCSHVSFIERNNFSTKRILITITKKEERAKRKSLMLFSSCSPFLGFSRFLTLWCWRVNSFQAPATVII